MMVFHPGQTPKVQVNVYIFFMLCVPAPFHEAPSCQLYGNTVSITTHSKNLCDTDGLAVP